MPRLLLTIWLVFLGFFAEGLLCPSQAMGHLEFAVDARTCISTIGYDGVSKAGFGYDRTAVLTTTESAKQSAGPRTFFVNFAQFLAAGKGVGLTL